MDLALMVALWLTQRHLLLFLVQQEHLLVVTQRHAPVLSQVLVHARSSGQTPSVRGGRLSIRYLILHVEILLYQPQLCLSRVTRYLDVNEQFADFLIVIIHHLHPVSLEATLTIINIQRDLSDLLVAEYDTLSV